MCEGEIGVVRELHPNNDNVFWASPILPNGNVAVQMYWTSVHDVVPHDGRDWLEFNGKLVGNHKSQ